MTFQLFVYYFLSWVNCFVYFFAWLSHCLFTIFLIESAVLFTFLPYWVTVCLFLLLCMLFQMLTALTYVVVDVLVSFLIHILVFVNFPLDFCMWVRFPENIAIDGLGTRNEPKWQSWTNFYTFPNYSIFFKNSSADFREFYTLKNPQICHKISKRVKKALALLP